MDGGDDDDDAIWSHTVIVIGLMIALWSGDRDKSIREILEL